MAPIDFGRSVNLPQPRGGGRLYPPHYYSPIQIFRSSDIHATTITDDARGKLANWCGVVVNRLLQYKSNLDLEALDLADELIIDVNVSDQMSHRLLND